MAPFELPEPDAIRDLLQKVKREPRTVRLHSDNLERLRKRGVHLSDVDGTLIDLHAMGKPTTVKTYVSAVVCMLREMPEHAGLLKRYRKHLSQLSDHIDKSYDGSTLTDRQQANWIEWEDIVKKRAELAQRAGQEDADAATIYDHLLLVMYSVLAPGRNDYCEMEIVRDRKRVPRSNNFYIINKDGQDIMVLNRYKTAKHHGQRRVRVPEQVQSVVRDSLEKLPRRYLFAQIKDPHRPWTSQYTTNRMGRVFPGKRWGSALMRKIVTTEFSKRRKGSRVALAKAMGHCLDTSERYYNDVDKTVENDMGIIL